MEKIISLIVYMSCFIISIFFCYKYQRYYEVRKNEGIVWHKKFVWFLLIISAPVILSTIRNNVGTDFPAYVGIFKSINTASLREAIAIYGREPLYLLFNKIAFLLFKQPWGIFLISSFLIHIFTISGIDFFKDYISMPFALFIFYMMHFSMGLNIIRQMIAVSIVFFSLRYIYMKKPIEYGVFIIIATMFHNSALICLIFYFISDFLYNDNVSHRGKSYRKLTYTWLIVLSPLIAFVGVKLLLRIPVFEKYRTYISNDYVLSFSFLIEILVLLIPVLFYRKKIAKEDKKIDSFIDLSLLNITFKGIVSFTSWGSRLSLYTNVFYYILPPVLLNSLESKENKRIIRLYYMAFIIIRYLLNHVILFNTHEVYPYNTIFDFI